MSQDDGVIRVASPTAAGEQIQKIVKTSETQTEKNEKSEKSEQNDFLITSETKTKEGNNKITKIVIIHEGLYLQLMIIKTIKTSWSLNTITEYNINAIIYNPDKFTVTSVEIPAFLGELSEKAILSLPISVFYPLFSSELKISDNLEDIPMYASSLYVENDDDDFTEEKIVLSCNNQIYTVTPDSINHYRGEIKESISVDASYFELLLGCHKAYVPPNLINIVSIVKKFI